MKAHKTAGFVGLACAMALGAIGCGAAPEKAASFPAGEPSPAAPVEVSATGGDEAGAPATARAERESPAAPQARPGLGTEWGETRQSRISTVPFVRADFDSPFATASLFYNDREGARAMASSAGFRRTSSGGFSVADGAVQIGLRDGSGEMLDAFSAGGRDFVVGEAGRRYTIVVRNLTSSRFEVVASVDGLDVLDGKSASFRKRGYILDAHDELEIDGFRQSTESVAAFRFGSVRDSYAGQKHGDTRNVGVIGVAVFHERGDDPFDREARRRNRANPFPGQFASPP
jgi:hypothetical protein